jgi:hypothetical protein
MSIRVSAAQTNAQIARMQQFHRMAKFAPIRALDP